MSASAVRDLMAGTGAGATLLPYAMPSGDYINRASYPIALSMPLVDEIGEITINGNVVARVDSRKGSLNAYRRQTITAIIPSGASFNIFAHNGVGRAYATALANNATWAQTGIVFPVSAPTIRAQNLASTPDFRSVYYCRGYAFDESTWSGRNIFYAADAGLHNLDCGEGASSRGRNIAVFGYRYNSLADPFSFMPVVVPMRNLARVTGVVSLDINQGRHRCQGIEESRNNLDQVNALRSIIFDVAQPSWCTEPAARNVFSGCPYTGCPVAVWEGGY